MAFPHGVLVEAKKWQPVLDELAECVQSLLPCHGPTKRRERARVIGEFLIDQLNDVLSDGVGLEACGLRNDAWALLAKTAPVVGIKIPLTAHGFFAVHQNAGFVAKLAVEVLLTELLSALGVLSEVPHGAEKMRVVEQFKRQLVVLCNFTDELQHPPLTRCREHQLLGFELLNGFGQFTVEGMAVARIIEWGVDQRLSMGLQVLGKMPHGAQKHHGALLG